MRNTMTLTHRVSEWWLMDVWKQLFYSKI